MNSHYIFKTKRKVIILLYALRLYFSKKLPRDKYNFKTRMENALCYATWEWEDK